VDTISVRHDKPTEALTRTEINSRTVSFTPNKPPHVAIKIPGPLPVSSHTE
jgi:hypothetical protein